MLIKQLTWSPPDGCDGPQLKFLISWPRINLIYLQIELEIKVIKSWLPVGNQAHLPICPLSEPPTHTPVVWSPGKNNKLMF